MGRRIESYSISHPAETNVLRGNDYHWDLCMRVCVYVCVCVFMGPYVHISCENVLLEAHTSMYFLSV